MGISLKFSVIVVRPIHLTNVEVILQNSKESLHASEQPLFKVFSDEYYFEIPSYQRPYSWTPDEAGELLDDLIAAAGTEAAEARAPYFLGSIVLIKMRDEPRAEVVDGQQRITTLTILLSALRELAPAEKIEYLTGFILEKANPYTGTEDRFRIIPRARDAEFFRDFVLVKGGISKLIKREDTLPDSQRNLRDNARLFLKKLGALSEDQRDALTSFIMRRCYLVVVSATDRESAYMIFSVMNSRGLDLSTTDILKAEIIGEVATLNKDLYTQKWEDIEEELGRQSFEDLFSHIRMIYKKAKAERALVQEFKQYVRPLDNPARFIDETLIPLADSFDVVKSANYESGDVAATKEINASLKWLLLLDNTDWVPVAIAFFRKNYGRPETLLTFVKDLERLAYGMFVQRTYVTARIARYGRVLTEIDRAIDLTIDSSSMQLDQFEKRNAILALSGDIYLQVKIRLPVLLRLDAALSDSGVIHDVSTVTVEHVLPQTPSSDSNWLTLFPDTQERERLTNVLGNLALLSGRKNSQAQNFDFERKKMEYFSRGKVATFAITTQVLHEKNWSPATIEARQRQFIGILADAWRL